MLQQWMDLEGITLGEINQPEKNKISYDLLFVKYKILFQKAHGDRELTDG